MIGLWIIVAVLIGYYLGNSSQRREDFNNLSKLQNKFIMKKKDTYKVLNKKEVIPQSVENIRKIEAQN